MERKLSSIWRGSVFARNAMDWEEAMSKQFKNVQDAKVAVWSHE
jgi:hypothetical protein